LTCVRFCFSVAFMTRWERIAKRVDGATKPTRRLTKGNIAQDLGISRPALNRRLSGEVAWHYDELEKLAMLLGTTVNELVSETNGEGTGS
jgi:hypothetical protein